MIREGPPSPSPLIDDVIERSSLLDVNGNSYAWGKTARLICEPHYLQTLQNTIGTFVAIDLCSAFPLWPQIMRERHLSTCYDEARKIVGRTIVSLNTKQSKLAPDLQLPSLSEFDDEAKKRLRIAVSDKVSLPRKLIEAVVQEILLAPPQPESAGRFLFKRLVSAKTSYHKEFELEEKVGRGRWEIILTTINPRTLKEYLVDLLGDKKTTAFLTDLSMFLSKQCLPLPRKRLAYSLDIDDPQLILNAVHESFPQYVINTQFFSRAGLLAGKHIVADVAKLPFEPNTVSLYTCVEGYPYYFRDLPYEDHLAFFSNIYQTLKPGGRAVFFPWQIRFEGSKHRAMLLEIEKYCESIGAKVYKKEYEAEEVIAQMGDREAMLTLHSPIFTDEERRETLTELVVEKLY